MTQNEIDKILALVHNKEKLGAMKLLKDTAHIGLKEAKEIIDDLFLGKVIDLNARVDSARNHHKENYESNNPTCNTGGTMSMTRSEIDKIKNLVKEGSKLAAVKVLMDSADINLKDAKDIIDNFALGKISDLEESVATAKNRYTDNYERISATCDADGTNVHFYYQKGQNKEEVTPSHPMWQRVKAYYTTTWEDAPEDIAQTRRIFAQTVLQMEEEARAIQRASPANKKNTLFLEKGSSGILKWSIIIALILILLCYLFLYA